MWYIKLAEATNVKTPVYFVCLIVLVAYFLLVLFCVYASTLRKGDQRVQFHKKNISFYYILLCVPLIFTQVLKH